MSMLGMKKMRYQQGLTIVEIMVALAISTLLIMGIIQILINNKQTYRMQEGMARLQENARFAMEFISRDIRQAGYRGCTRNLPAIQNLIKNPPPEFKPTAGIQGWEFTGGDGTAPGATYDLNATDAKPVATKGETTSDWINNSGDTFDEIHVMRGSDVLRVWRGATLGSESGTVKDIDISGGAGKPFTITVADTTTITDEDIILVGDCQGGDIMQVCDVKNAPQQSKDLIISDNCSPGNDINNLPASLALNSEFTQLKSGIYFIGKKGNLAKNPPSLYYAELSLSDPNSETIASPQELIQGVDTMQVLYGEVTDADDMADSYTTADKVGDWGSIVSVKIGLLFRTVDEVDTQDTHGGVYEVNGTNINLVVNDRRPRKVYFTTIVLRNRTI
jgi:type IV pilus assembly protein PilW